MKVAFTELMRQRLPPHWHLLSLGKIFDGNW
jgi:hypothetical protein